MPYTPARLVTVDHHDGQPLQRLTLRAFLDANAEAFTGSEPAFVTCLDQGGYKGGGGAAGRFSVRWAAPIIPSQHVSAPVLAALVGAAQAYAADLESGLADGTYDDRADLDSVKAALAILAPPNSHPSRAPDYLERFDPDHRPAADKAYGDGFADGHDDLATAVGQALTANANSEPDAMAACLAAVRGVLEAAGDPPGEPLPTFTPDPAGETQWATITVRLIWCDVVEVAAAGGRAALRGFGETDVRDLETSDGWAAYRLRRDDGLLGGDFSEIMCAALADALPGGGYEIHSVETAHGEAA